MSIYTTEFVDLAGWGDEDVSAGVSSAVVFDGRSCLSLAPSAVGSTGGNLAQRRANIGTAPGIVLSFDFYVDAFAAYGAGSDSRRLSFRYRFSDSHCVAFGFVLRPSGGGLSGWARDTSPQRQVAGGVGQWISVALYMSPPQGLRLTVGGYPLTGAGSIANSDPSGLNVGDLEISHSAVGVAGGHFAAYVSHLRLEPDDLSPTRGLLSDVAYTCEQTAFSMGHLFEFGWADGADYLADGRRDVNWNGRTYLATGDLLEIPQIKDTISPALDSIDISLSGANQENIYKALALDYTNVPVSLYRVFFTEDHTLIGSPVEIYAGVLNAPTITENPYEGTSRVTWRATSHWNGFERVAGRRCNDADQQKWFPGDRGLEYASKSVAKLKWGAV